MDLSDEEFTVLHTLVFEECIYPSEGRYDEDDMALINAVYTKVCDEAKRRGFWWPR